MFLLEERLLNTESESVEAVVGKPWPSEQLKGSRRGSNVGSFFLRKSSVGY